MDRDAQLEIEKYKADCQASLAKWQAEHTSNMEEWRFELEWGLRSSGWAVGFAKLAIQGLLTISGGAVIALSAFLGNIWSGGCHVGDAMFFLYFIWAAALAVICAGLSYLAQLCFTEIGTKKRYIGFCFQVPAIIAGVIGIVLFVMGGYSAYDNLKGDKMIVCPKEITDNVSE